PRYMAFLFVRSDQMAGGIKFIGFFDSVGECCIESRLRIGSERARRRAAFVVQAHPQGHLAARRNFQSVVASALGALAFGVHPVVMTVHDVFVKRVFDEWTSIGRAVKALAVGFVLGEEDLA